MKKSISASNDFCPQTLFLYGTYKEDQNPNFGLFCWFSYCWDDGLAVMAAIGGKKLTLDRIRATGMFSANLVTEELLPLADYFGNTDGHAADKMKLPVEIEKGQVLDVPVLAESPYVYELEVKQSIVLDGSEVFLCKVRNVLADEMLCDDTQGAEQRINATGSVDNTQGIARRIKAIRPVHTTCGTYFGWNGDAICPWGKAQDKL